MKVEKIIKLIINTIEYLMILVIFYLFYMIQPINTKRIIYIPKGNVNYIIKKLQNDDIDITNFDKYTLLLLGTPQSGWIDLKFNKMTKFDFLDKLTKSKAALKKITIIPGETDYFIYKQISKKMGFSDMKCNFIPEGFLYPNTYYLPYGFDIKEVCVYLYKVSLLEHKKISKKIFGYWNFNKYYKYLIIASIIQKEAGNKKEMKIISSVIYNRLKKHIRLQMDGSLNYAQYSHTKITSQMIKNDNTKFNTYKYYGLPNKPVCVSSQEAIIASIFPAHTDYLYFVRVNGIHKFSKTYKKHLLNIHRN